jgi:hypothetical protein
MINPRRRMFFWVLVPAFIFGLAGVVMGLWNAILPTVAGWRPLSYWQALGLLVLCRLLFGGLHLRPWGGPWSPSKGPGPQKWATLTDEERQELRQRWQERCQQRDKK